MKKIVLVIVFLVSIGSYSQEDAWVYFNDKPNAQSYFENPLTMLTQRSLDRRISQNIPLDIKDIPIFQNYIDQIEASNGIVVKAKSKWFNALHIQGSQSEIMALTELTFVNRVDFANRNLNVGGRMLTPKKTKKFNKTFETEVIFNYGTSFNQIQMLNGHLLHQQNFTGSGKIIAVMDGGFPGVNTASTFSRLRNNNKILGGYDYVNRNTDFYTGISHGTLVLSTMGGYKNNQLVGTAPDASYYLFITEDGINEGPLELSLWVEAAEEADRLGVDIITTSLGYTQFNNSNYDFNYEDMNGNTSYISKGVDIAFSKGIICVVSAGNSGNDIWHYISSPADALHALTVGAVDSESNYASFSSQGPTSDLRVKPDVSAQGLQAVLSNTDGNITTASGTSFSGPIIAGMVASLWQALPEKSNEQIMQLVKESASIYNNPNDEIGYGIPDFSLALNNALGINNLNYSNFIIAPNPTSSNISITFPQEIKNAKLMIFNTIGQLVINQDVSNQNAIIQMNVLDSGMYFYHIQSTTFSKFGKILKQ